MGGADWRRHIPGEFAYPPLGISQTELHEYVAHFGPLRGRMPVYSMLSGYELALIFSLAKDRWTGRGEMVDLGPYMGLTTYCFWNGLRLNQAVRARERRKRLHAFDLFVRNDESGLSTFPTFVALNQAGQSYFDVYPGDFLSLIWIGKPVEVLFVDIAKSVALQDHVVRQFFPTLVPQALVVQQDYGYFDQYWIHILMELFREHFRMEELIFGGSALYTLVKPLPDLRGWRLEDAAPREQWAALHRRHLEAAPEHIQGVLWAAHAKLLLDQGRMREAQAALDAATVVVHPDPVQDFSSIIKSNRDMVAALFRARVDGGAVPA